MKTNPSIQFYNQLLNNQDAIDQMNSDRPNIYIYTDFGGGKNVEKPLSDLQTSGEIASAAWKSTLHQKLYINDSAKPLTPSQAAVHLAQTFPYAQNLKTQNSSIQKIVVHVVDPGVGNSITNRHPQPRSIVLRKDGTIFIGPDNGTLSQACPPGSISGIWEINIDQLNRLTGIDLLAGGTFHGRDLFCEVAFRVAAKSVSLNEIGVPYPSLELKNRFNDSGYLPLASPIQFANVKTDRFIDQLHSFQDDAFEQAFLLGIMQSSLYAEKHSPEITKAKKIFMIEPEGSGIPLVAIVNLMTGNVYIGPNNGLATSFFKYYPSDAWEAFEVPQDVFKIIQQEKNNESAYLWLKSQARFTYPLEEIDFLGSEKSLVRDAVGRPKTLLARIWIDGFGSIKTTAPSTILNEVKNKEGSVRVLLNNLEKEVIFAETFSEVPKEQLFLYNGSTGTIGPNPHRSTRYVELSANGIYGKFGVDFFKNKKLPQSGQLIHFHFDYVEKAKSS